MPRVRLLPDAVMAVFGCERTARYDSIQSTATARRPSVHQGVGHYLRLALERVGAGFGGSFTDGMQRSAPTRRPETSLPGQPATVCSLLLIEQLSLIHREGSRVQSS
jgi:hypothetical protein